MVDHGIPWSSDHHFHLGCIADDVIPAIVFNTSVVLTSVAVFSAYAVLTPVTYAF